MAKLFGKIYTGKIGDAIDAISYTEAGSDIITRSQRPRWECIHQVMSD